eukprot:tig00000241_g20893.t1
MPPVVSAPVPRRSILEQTEGGPSVVHTVPSSHVPPKRVANKENPRREQPPLQLQPALEQTPESSGRLQPRAAAPGAQLRPAALASPSVAPPLQTSAASSSRLLLREVAGRVEGSVECAGDINVLRQADHRRPGAFWNYEAKKASRHCFIPAEGQMEEVPKSEWTPLETKFLGTGGSNPWRVRIFRPTSVPPGPSVSHASYIESKIRLAADQLPLAVPPRGGGVENLTLTYDELEQRDIHGGVVSIDPGVHDFLVLYAPDGRVIEIGPYESRARENKLQKAWLWMDMSVPQPQQSDNVEVEDGPSLGNGEDRRPLRSRTRRRLKKKALRAFDHDHNRTVEALRQIARFMVYNYNVVLLPELEFETSDMALMQWTHNEFRCILADAATRHRLECRVYLVSEHLTSKTCGKCGAINNDLGSSRTFVCPNCGIKMHRDMNSARNVLLRVASGVDMDNRLLAGFTMPFVWGGTVAPQH